MVLRIDIFHSTIAADVVETLLALRQTHSRLTWAGMERSGIESFENESPSLYAAVTERCP
jgi:hypothetical protein